MQNFHSSSRRGFTLIEMLIVIGIIALLSALIFPALGRAREGARTKVCLSNLKQLSLGFQQYVQDNGRRYPGAAQKQKWFNGGHWVKGDKNYGGTEDALALDGAPYTYQTGKKADVEGGALFPYVKSTQVYVCPSNADGKAKKLSYSMNCAIGGMSEVRMTQPTEIILLIDEEKNNDGYWYAVNGTDSTDQLTQAHNKGGNLLYADGHAKYILYDKFPVDLNGGALKTRTTESPRFYDLSFGATGFWNPTPASAFGSCVAP